jgi:hypothetical protein
MDDENIYDKIQQIFGSMPSNFSILEEKIDIELQMEYFEFSKNLKKSDDPDEILTNKNLLFEPSACLAEKKLMLVQLASIDNIDAYRTIEKYSKKPDKTLKGWTTLALQESRMLIESKLLDENQVFISTGLGGKGAKLRYFVVLITRENDDFSELQKKIIKNEFEFILKKYDSELEEINFSENLATLMAIVPLKISIKGVFKEAIEESNLYGDFMATNFIVTNVKILTFNEIRAFLDKQKREI